MDAFAGFDPQVGEIRALRSFRIDASGALHPLFQGAEPWVDGDNVAQCARSSHASDGPHPAPDADCTCGFYAYGSEAAALEYANARYVLAVVACWGRVIAGTRGLRAGRARIEALWLSDAVPPELGSRVANRYPRVETYGDCSVMLREHAPTMLDCYEPTPTPVRRNAVVARGALLVAGLAGGLLPTALMQHHASVLSAWIAVLGLVVVSGAVLSRRRSDPVVARRLVLTVALALWMLSAFAGIAGAVLLRLPLIQLVVVTALHRRQLDRAARRFPARIDDRRS